MTYLQGISDGISLTPHSEKDWLADSRPKRFWD
jgi:hypothetical protein